jgi:probable lipoprotein NlpC
MKLFFERKINEKLLVFTVLSLTLFLFSCAPHRKTTIRKSEEAIGVVEAARRYIGTPYKYGGTSRTGMDCSGLLINTFRAINVELPRSSEDQSKIGQEVSMGELMPGDLLFFATGKKRRKVTHVGMVTDVLGRDNVKFIHSSSSLGVVETNLYAEYYQKRFVTARRVIR